MQHLYLHLSWTLNVVLIESTMHAQVLFYSSKISWVHVAHQNLHGTLTWKLWEPDFVIDVGMHTCMAIRSVTSPWPCGWRHAAYTFTAAYGGMSWQLDTVRYQLEIMAHMHAEVFRLYSAANKVLIITELKNRGTSSDITLYWCLGNFFWPMKYSVNCPGSISS